MMSFPSGSPMVDEATSQHIIWHNYNQYTPKDYRNYVDGDDENISFAMIRYVEKHIQYIIPPAVEPITPVRGSPTVLRDLRDFIHSPALPLVPCSNPSSDLDAASSPLAQKVQRSGRRKVVAPSANIVAASGRANTNEPAGQLQESDGPSEDDVQLQLDQLTADFNGRNARIIEMIVRLTARLEQVEADACRCACAGHQAQPCGCVQHEPMERTPTPSSPSEPGADAAEHPAQCPEYCGCSALDNADEHLIGAWSPRQSPLGHAPGILDRHNLRILDIAEDELDPEIIRRAEYVAEALHEIPQQQLEQQPRHVPVQYFPLDTAHVLEVDPPQPEWMIGLFRDVFLVDEPVEYFGRRDSNVEDRGEFLSITEYVTAHFRNLMEIRAIVYTLMTHPNPSTFLARQLSRLEEISFFFTNINIDLRSRIEQVNCRRLRAVTFLTIHLMNTIRAHLMLRIQPNHEAPAIRNWTWRRVMENVTEFVQDMQRDGADAGNHVALHFLRAGERQGVRRAEVIAMFEFCRYVVRRIDLFFTLLRMEGWAFRRYDRLLDWQNDTPMDFIRVMRMPTLYDSVIEIEYADEDDSD